MLSSHETIRGLRTALASGSVRPTDLAEQALARSNQNTGRNTYLWQDPSWTMAEAARAEELPRGTGGSFGDGRSPLWGLPISVKDCFDLTGAPTTCGVPFYRDLNGIAAHDSWLVAQLRGAGAVITGKTHMHPLAYGITGENADFGDSIQPDDKGALTGGSSSGAAASVMEGSAVAAIGTDTGGSIRAPAAFCGLAGYRASLGRGQWRGGAHLAESFDTMGWLFQHLEDAALLGTPFAADEPDSGRRFTRFAIVDDGFLYDSEPEIITSVHSAAAELQALGLRSSTFSSDWLADSFEIYAPIQAAEAARIHAGNFDHFRPDLRERLEWGARIHNGELEALRRRHDDFRSRIDALLSTHDLLLMAVSPVSRLAAGADHSLTRPRILRYTTPFSLAGVPVVTIPCAVGGVQLAATRGRDQTLLQLASRLGASRKPALRSASSPVASTPGS
jgi:aspartyl-tRNA(Asn)/glutamyl-tRNA(Gln) amidotransferase subunit A